MKKKQFRILASCFILLIIFIAFLASLSEESTTYYHTAGEVLASPSEFRGEKIRVMGLVKEGSVEWSGDKLELRFLVTDDMQGFLPVRYKGLKPDMFREGQGVVAQGVLNKNGELLSDQLLVKHTEEYKKSGEERMSPDLILRSLNKGGNI